MGPGVAPGAVVTAGTAQVLPAVTVIDVVAAGQDEVVTHAQDLTEPDLAECVDLFVETFAAPPWDETWEPEDARLRLGDFLRTPRSRGVVLRDDSGAIVGFALGHLERFGADDHFLLQEMCVRTHAQRSGHGAALLVALADRMPGVTHWHLLTARDSPAAAFYTKHGFRPAGRIGILVRP